MPEDLDDKLTDFTLMLEGYCADRKDVDLEKTRLLVYWYALKTEMREKLNG
jgi:hypothetical protein